MPAVSALFFPRANFPSDGFWIARPPLELAASATMNVAGDETAMPGETDADLARAAQAGDRAALGRLVERHTAAISRLLWRFARTPTDLDDLVQETFLRVVRSLPTWSERQPLIHWMMRIATNVGRDYFRRNSVRSRYLVDRTVDDSGAAESEPEAIDPGADPAARAAANEVKALLGALPPDDRALLTLQYLEGWDLATIAQHFGWTVTATKLRAWRARRRLHDHLTQLGYP